MSVSFCKFFSTFSSQGFQAKIGGGDSDLYIFWWYMRTLNRNKRPLYYALYQGKATTYYEDSEGNKYDTGEAKLTYSNPVSFRGNIAMSGSGYSEAMEFGLDLSDYNATLVMDKDALPIDEQSLIWQDSEPEVDSEGHAIKDSADYIVIKVNKSLNVDKYILKKLVKGNG